MIRHLIEHATRRRATIGLLVLLLAGCGLISAGGSQFRVSSEQFPWADLSRCRTYRWWSPPLAQSNRPFDEQDAVLDWRIRAAVDHGLAARGYAAATTPRADLVVSYGLSIADASTSSFRDYLNYRAEGGTEDMGAAFVGYERGSLTIALADTASGRPAWRGSASAALGKGDGSRIDPAVQAILQRLPAAAP